MFIKPPAEFDREGEQFTDVVRILPFHQVEQFLAAVLRELGQQVGRFVGSHLFQHVGHLFIGHRLQQPRLEIRLHLLEGVGHRADVERSEQLVAFGPGQVGNDLRQVGRVQFGNLVPGDFQPHRLVAVQQFHMVPGDGAAPACRFSAPALQPVGQPGPQPAEEAQPPDVDVGDVIVVVDPRDLQIVDAHDAHAVGVDDLLVEDVARQIQILLRHRIGRNLGQRLESGMDGASSTATWSIGMIVCFFPARTTIARSCGWAISPRGAAMISSRFPTGTQSTSTTGLPIRTLK